MKTIRPTLLLLLLLLVVVPSYTYSQNAAKIKPTKLNAFTWGYQDLLGEWIIPPQFSKADGFTKDDIAIVGIADFDIKQYSIIGATMSTNDINKALYPKEFGLIDLNGDILVKYKYDATQKQKDDKYAKALKTFSKRKAVGAYDAVYARLAQVDANILAQQLKEQARQDSIALMEKRRVGSSTMGQIPIRETGIIEKAVLRPERFDSLENIRALDRGKEYNYLKYLEQEVYFIPVNENLRAPAFPYIVNSNHQGFYRSDSLGNVRERVFYSDIQNQYYLITNLLERRSGKFSKPENYKSYNLAFLLKEQKTGGYLLWCFSSPNSELNEGQMHGYSIDNEYFKPYYALLTSYFAKVKTAFEGQSLIARFNNSKFVDINTGELVNITKGDKWICKEISLIPLKGKSLLVPFFILESLTGEAIKIRLRDKLNSTSYLPNGFMTEEQYLYEEEQKQLNEEQRLAGEKAREEQRLKEEDNFKQMCISKYGQKYGTLIVNGKVTLGMNREMCTLAWGEPYRRNRTIVAGLTREQWVYGWYHYLYFDNGILVGIQD